MGPVYWTIRFLLAVIEKVQGSEIMAGGNLIYGAIGFLLGGLLGGYFAGRHFAKEYRQTIQSLQDENGQLRDQLRTAVGKKLEEREKTVQKAEKKLDKSLVPIRTKAAERMRKMAQQDRIDIRPEKPSTAEIEKLSEEYRSDAFDAHFADRVAPDDSDDVGEEEDQELTREEKRMLRKDGYLQRGNGKTLMTRPFAEAYAKASKNPVDFDSDDNDDPFVDIPVVSEKEKERHDLCIRMIDKDTFKHDLEVRDSDTYTYYQEDGVLVNDATQEIETDQIGVLGEAAMEIIEDTEKDELYIDNEPDDMLYEIIVDHNMGYYRDVLGY